MDDLISRHENEALSAVATQVLQQFALASPKRGIVYVRSYTTGAIVGEALGPKPRTKEKYCKNGCAEQQGGSSPQGH